MGPTDVTLDILRKIQGGISDLRQDVQENSRGIEALGARHDGTDKRLEGMDKRLDGTDKRLEGMDKRLEGMDKRLSAIEVGHGRRLAAIEGRLHDLVEVTTLSVTRQLDLSRRVDAIEGRVEALEPR